MSIRKNFIIILFFLSVLNLFGQNVSDFVYEVKGTGNLRTITITGYNGTEKDILPDKINNTPVTIIGIVIPDTIIVIEDHAFELNNLTKVILPASIQNIGDSSFSKNKLTEILLSTDLQSIGKGAFSNNRLAEIFISPNVMFVGRSAFVANPLQRIIIGQNIILEVGSIPDLLDVWEQFAAHYNNSSKQSGIYNTR